MDAKHKAGEGVQIKPSTMQGWWDIAVRFNDGVLKGHDHDRAYGFSLQAESVPEAKVLLRSHMLRMIDVLNTELFAENR